MIKKNKCVAVILAGGQGRRMNSPIPKQYLLIKEKPVLYYAVRGFEESGYIDEIILVVQAGEEDRIRNEAENNWGISKLTAVVPGGRERFHSVWSGLERMKGSESESTLVFIHDGARPFISGEIIQRGYETAVRYKAAVAGMRSTDTVKTTDAEGVVMKTLDRNYVWRVQTPQIFEYRIIYDAYRKLMACDEIDVTDDAQVVEKMMHMPVRMFEGSEKNIKITTREDLDVAELFLRGHLMGFSS